MQQAKTIISIVLAAALVAPGGFATSTAVLCLDEHGRIGYEAAGCDCARGHGSHEATIAEGSPDAGPTLLSNLDKDDCGSCIDIPLPTLGIGKAEAAVLLVQTKNTGVKPPNHESAKASMWPGTTSSFTLASRSQRVDTYLAGLRAVSLRI